MLRAGAPRHACLKSFRSSLSPRASSSSTMESPSSYLSRKLPASVLKIPPIPVKSIIGFTHTSFHNASREPFEAQGSDPIQDYERMELFGDAILNFVVTRMIRTSYPRLTVGAATNLRAQLVNNQLLELLADHFGLPEKLRAAADQVEKLRGYTTVKAALFEAYICALYEEKGAEVAEEFLRRVMTPLLIHRYNQLKGADSNGQVLTAAPDYSVLLHEWSQRGPNRLASFGRTSLQGPPHAPTSFTVPLTFGARGDQKTIYASSTTLKRAKQIAAYKALVALNIV